MFRLALVLAFGCLTAAPALAADCLVVGTWNIEHFGSGGRGFPETSLPNRTDSQLDGIAQTIRDDVEASVLILNEINGRRGRATSEELDDLVVRLGPEWKYAIDKSGGTQRIAMIWNTDKVEVIAQQEIFVAEKIVQDADIFERDPLAVYFRATGQNGAADFLVVGLHLKSGQQNTQNHDVAMERLRGELRALRGHSAVLPSAEDDILVGGDLNASPYDNKEEEFFETFNRGNWKLLAEGDSYPGTRINGSQIDYLIVTRSNSRQKGLWNQEIAESPAKVWRELAEGNMNKYRKNLSDHFPVTTCIDASSDED
jgi:hypothetical protein